MPYNESLAVRIREIVKRRQGLTEKKMFGGICFLVNGNMCCGVDRNKLMVRVGPLHYEGVLAKKHVRPMDFTGRPMKGHIYVGPGGYRTKKLLTNWLEYGLGYAKSLPGK